MNFFSKNLKNSKKAFSLIEMVVYISILALIMVVVINMLAAIVQSQRNIKASKRVEESAILGFERMVREIRNAQSVDPTSALGSSPGRLLLNYTDSLGNPRTVEFYLNSGVLTLKEDGVVSGPLSLGNASTTNLTFHMLDSGNSKGVKIKMTVESGQDSALKTMTFYTTAVMRGTY